MAVSQTILERVFAKVETSFGTAVSLAGSNFMRHTRCRIKAEQGNIPSSDKTGSISQQEGSAGTRGGTWSLDFEARPNGAAGVAPDCDPILQAVFGAAPTVVSSTSVTYNLANVIKSFTMGRYRQPSGVMQQLSIGSVATELGFSFEQQNNCRFTASGTSLWPADSITFASLGSGSPGKGGLSSFPAEPSSPVSNGTPVSGLTGTATLDGSTSVQVQAASVRMATGIEVPRDRLFNGQFGSSPERGTLAVTIDLKIVDEDISAVTTLYTKALTRTKIPIILTAGSVSGSIIEWTAGQCLLPMPDLDDSARKWASNLQGIIAYPTTSSSLDEITLAFK